MLEPRNESLSATFQEAKATGAILPRLSPCLRTEDGVKKISSLIPRFDEVSGSQGLQLLGSLFSSHSGSRPDRVAKAEGKRAGFPDPSGAPEGKRKEIDSLIGKRSEGDGRGRRRTQEPGGWCALRPELCRKERIHRLRGATYLATESPSAANARRHSISVPGRPGMAQSRLRR
jgi:hypothetical protein